MTINVHTYYRNRLALEEAVERARVRQDMAVRYATSPRPAPAPRRPIAIPVMVVYGVLVGLAYAAWVGMCMGTGLSAPLLASMGLVWGLIWGIIFHCNRERLSDFLQSLTAAPVVVVPSHEEVEPLDLTWMNQAPAPVAAWTPAPTPLLSTAAEPMSTFPKKKTVPNTLIDQPAKPTMGSMLNQLTETLGETAEPKAPPKAKVWGTPVEMARTAR